MIAGHHRAERIDRPGERLGAQRRWHLGPVVVRIRRIQRIVGKRLHELCAKARLEVSRRHSRVHCVPLALAPLGPSVLEPHLEWRAKESKQ